MARSPCTISLMRRARHGDILGQGILAELHRLQELFEQDFSGVHRCKFFAHGYLLMVIRYLDLVGIPFTPLKAPVPAVLAQANAPLVVNADTILSGALAGELLQPITRWYAEIIQAFGCIQDGQFSPGRHLLADSRALYGESSSGLKCNPPR